MSLIPLLMLHRGDKAGPLVRVESVERIEVRGLSKGRIALHLFPHSDDGCLNSPEPPIFIESDGLHDVRIGSGWLQATRVENGDDEVSVYVIR